MKFNNALVDSANKRFSSLNSSPPLSKSKEKRNKDLMLPSSNMPDSSQGEKIGVDPLKTDQPSLQMECAKSENMTGTTRAPLAPSSGSNDTSKPEIFKSLINVDTIDLTADAPSPVVDLTDSPLIGTKRKTPTVDIRGSVRKKIVVEDASKHLGLLADMFADDE